MTPTATNIEQSKKLLSIGIDPETADMYYCGYNHVYRNHMLIVGKAYKREDWEKDLMPAWSLAAIMGLLPKKIDVDEQDFDCELMMQYNLETERMEIGYCSSGVHGESADILSVCIDLIEQLIKKGYIKTKKKEQ